MGDKGVRTQDPYSKSPWSYGDLRLILSALWQALTVNQQRYFWPCAASAINVYTLTIRILAMNNRRVTFFSFPSPNILGYVIWV